MIGILVKTDNTYQVLDQADISNVLDGWIEIVRPRAAYQENLLKPYNVFVCDEEGLMKGLEVNKVGTVLYNGLKKPTDFYPIVGDIFITGEQGSIRSLTENEVNFYKKLLKKLNIKEGE